MRYEGIIEVPLTSAFMSYCSGRIWITAFPSRPEHRTVTLLCATRYLIEPFLLRLQGDYDHARSLCLGFSFSCNKAFDGGQELAALVTRFFLE